MFRSHIRSISCALPLLALAAGCNNFAKEAVTNSSSPVSDIPSIQQSTEIAQVKRAYRAKKYTDAIARLQALAKKPGLSPADTAYLERQIAICQDTASGRVSEDKKNNRESSRVLQTATATASSDCGPRALLFICQEKNIPASLPSLTKTAGMKPGVGVSIAGLAKAAQSVGFQAEGVQVDLDALRRVSPPAIAWVDGNHFVAVTNIKEDSATIHDPNKTGKEEVPLEKLLSRSGGVLLLLKQKQGNEKLAITPVAKN